VRNLQLVQDPAADELLAGNPFALLVGMLLDQHAAIYLPFWLRSSGHWWVPACPSFRDRRMSIAVGDR